MKKIGMIAATGCAVALCVALAGCGGSGTSTATSGAASGTTSGTTATATSGTSAATSGTTTEGDESGDSELMAQFAGDYTLVEMETADGQDLDEDALADKGWDYKLTLNEDGTGILDQGEGGAGTLTWSAVDESTLEIKTETDSMDVTVDEDGTLVMEYQGNTVYYALD